MTEDKDHDPVDEDLQGLLNELDQTEATSTPIVPPARIKRPKSQASPAPNPASPVVEEEDPVINKAKTKQRVEVVAPTVNLAKPDQKDNNEVSALISQITAEYTGFQKEVREKMSEDRSEIDRFIQLFSDRISEPEAAKSVYIESITALLTTRAGISTNSSKLLDSMAKMIASIKSLSSDTKSNIDLGELLKDEPD